MEIAFDRPDGDFPDRLDATLGELGLEDLHPAVHGAGGDEYLGYIDLVIFEFVADYIHSGQQSIVQDVARCDSLVKSLLDQRFDVVCLSLLQ
jgi:hypothetical protein